jgi:hypothetical protein
MQGKHLTLGIAVVLGLSISISFSMMTDTSVSEPYSVENFTHSYTVLDDGGNRLDDTKNGAVSFDAQLLDSNSTSSDPGILQLAVQVNADTNVTIVSSPMSYPFGLLNAVGTDSRFCLYPQDYTGPRSSSTSYRGPATRCPGWTNMTSIHYEHTPNTTLTTEYTLNQTEISTPGQYTVTRYVNYTLPERNSSYHLRFNVTFEIVPH